MTTVAALYVDPRGPYASMPDVDPWDEQRDARTYAGPHPVVAHPPCGSWGRFRNLASGTDADCAPLAVEQVRMFGGVLEHPAYSRLWLHANLPRPGELPDSPAATTGILEGGTPTHVVEHTRREGARRSGLKLCSHQQRRRTPPAFARWLVDLATTAVRPA